MKKMIGTLLFICIALNANAQLLWKVSGNGLTKPSYIMGTHHLAPLSITDSIAGMKKTLDETDQVYGEVKMADLQTPATMQLMQSMIIIPSDTTFKSLFAPKDYEAINTFCKENLKLDLEMAPKLKPAFIHNNIIIFIYMKYMGNFNPQEQLDTHFQTQATQKGKKVDGLEEIGFQFNLLFNDMSLKRQAATLTCIINNQEYTAEQTKRLTQAYMKQDLDAMYKLTQEHRNDACDMLPEEEDAMIYNRNKTWSEKLPAIMKAAPTFVAVGALHLPSEKGLLSLLKKQGYKVEPVK